MIAAASPTIDESRNAKPAATHRYQSRLPERAYHSALVWSEYCFLICVAIALVLIVIPPDWAFPGRRVIRQIPLLAALPIALLCIVGHLVSRPSTRLPSAALGPQSRLPTRLRKKWPWPPALTVLLPLLVLGAWIVAGSLHARIVENWQATFLNYGAYMAAAVAAAMIMMTSNAPTKLAQTYTQLIVVTAFAMAIGLVLAFGKRDIYHEQIFLAIPIAVTFATGRTRFRWIGCLFFLGLALLSMKNTSYLIALLAAMYIAVLLWLNGMQRAPSLKQLWLHYLAFVGAASIAVAVCFLLYFREHYLPSGNVEFREFTYRAAWQQFLDSPIWGTAFSAESVRKFTLYTVGIARNRLPTHSDLMDLLANGGLLAIGLWLFGYLRIGVFAYRRILAPRFLHYPWASQGHTFAAISLAAIVVYAFNPILLQPEMAFLVWTTLGMLVGLAASCDPELHAGEIARRLHASTAEDVAEQRGRHQVRTFTPRKSQLAFASVATRVEPPK